MTQLYSRVKNNDTALLYPFSEIALLDPLRFYNRADEQFFFLISLIQISQNPKQFWLLILFLTQHSFSSNLNMLIFIAAVNIVEGSDLFLERRISLDRRIDLEKRIDLREG